jgi:toxin-antitoxin system PIN domain toxin
VILVDANLLLYAVVSDYEQHNAAHAWLDERLNSPIRVGLPWVSLLACLRIATNPRIFPDPLPMKEAWKRAEHWLDAPNVWSPEPTERHQARRGRIRRGVASSPKRLPDAHLAALALEHGLLLCSTDGDFSRFDGLRWENPIAAAS